MVSKKFCHSCRRGFDHSFGPTKFFSPLPAKLMAQWPDLIRQAWFTSSNIGFRVPVMTPNFTRTLLSDAASRAASYLEGLENRRVAPRAEAMRLLRDSLAGSLPDGPSAAGEVIASLDSLGSPATVANAAGRYFGFVTGGAFPVAVAANFLATAWDQNSFSRVSSPAGAAFEEAALRWIKEALGVPAQAEGAFVTGATMANFTCLAAARHRVLDTIGWNVEARGLFGAPEISVVVGEEAHATLLKVISMLGLGRERVAQVPVDDQGRMRTNCLPDIEGPLIVCIQAGNVNSGSFDPAAKIIPWARRRNAWVHVDGAFGLWALASPDRAQLAAGFTDADSWATDAHKWLNVPYDCGIALVKDRAALGGAMSVSGSYLLAEDGRDALNYSPDASRRARAVEVWATLKFLGRRGLAELIERNCRQARRIADVLGRAGITVMNDVVLNQIVVTFGDEARTNAVISEIQDEGECWCGGTVWRGRSAMRISVSSWATTDDDIDRTIAAILRATAAL